MQGQDIEDNDRIKREPFLFSAIGRSAAFSLRRGKKHCTSGGAMFLVIWGKHSEKNPRRTELPT
jgi:hypothetical protein